MRDATVRLPEGWELDPTNTPEVLVATHDGPRGVDGFGIVVLPLGDQRFGRQFRSLARTHPGVRFERGPDTEVGGFPAMYASGRDTRDPGQWEVVLSMFDGEHGYTLSFSLHQRSRAAREALVDSVLASWEWQA